MGFGSKMRVEKINTRNMLDRSLVLQGADEARRCADETVKAAQEERSRTEGILSRSQEVLEKARKAVEISRLRRAERIREAERGKPGKRLDSTHVNQ